MTYSNALKIGLLGVPEPLLVTQGAVSREVAEAMAEGARTRLGADLGLALTGIAGPSGGTTEKPVGSCTGPWRARAASRRASRCFR